MHKISRLCGSLLLFFSAACAQGTPSDLGTKDVVPPRLGGNNNAPVVEDPGPIQEDVVLPRDPNDRDGDGFKGRADCDDLDETVYPGAPELCDHKDNDCDDFVDVRPVEGVTYYLDRDGDGLGDPRTGTRLCESPGGQWVTEGHDCDDDDPELRGNEFCLEEEGPIVYVAKHGDDENAGDVPIRAVFTINEGIERALACPGEPCRVLVAVGEYDEALTLGNGVDIFGNYRPDFFERSREDYGVTITSDEAYTVVADQLTELTTLDGLTVEGAVLEDTSGESSVAVWVRDSGDVVSLNDVVVYAGRGADGAPGVAGEKRTCMALGGKGGTSRNCGSSKGADGNSGGDATPGGVGGNGGDDSCGISLDLCNWANRSKVGNSGGQGPDGEDGEPGQATVKVLGSISEGSWVGAAGTPGQRGRNGGGGGGGGSGGNHKVGGCPGCNNHWEPGGRGGDGAPGGCGGGGGRAGGPGGASMGLLVAGSTVQFSNVVLYGGSGGNGGTGGAGHPGDEGGKQITVGLRGGRSKDCKGRFGVKWGTVSSKSGANGGEGGDGGHGAGGVGGVGGAAVTLAIAEGGAVVEKQAVQTLEGVGGSGGAGGAGPGRRGTAGKTGGVRTRYEFPVDSGKP